MVGVHDTLSDITDCKQAEDRWRSLEQPIGTPPQRTLGSVTINEAMQHKVLDVPIALPPRATSYVWDFGDGQSMTTPSPTVVHDYFGSISPGRVTLQAK